LPSSPTRRSSDLYLAASLDVTGDRDTGGLDLAARDPAWLDCLEAEVTEVDLGAALGQPPHAAAVLLAVLDLLRAKHRWIPAAPEGLARPAGPARRAGPVPERVAPGQPVPGGALAADPVPARRHRHRSGAHPGHRALRTVPDGRCLRVPAPPPGLPPRRPAPRHGAGRLPPGRGRRRPCRSRP